ncbi:MAG: hypothetical protein WAN86_11375 [Hyphomicrobiaceae bacterium]
MTAVDRQCGHSGAAAKLASMAAIEGVACGVGDAVGAAAGTGEGAQALVICALTTAICVLTAASSRSPD